MSEKKQGLRKTTLSLVDDAEEKHDFYVEEARKASNEQSILKEKGGLLERSLVYQKSNGAQAIIQTMLSEIRESIIEEEQRQRESENKKKHYSEVKRALDEAVKDLKEL